MIGLLARMCFFVAKNMKRRRLETSLFDVDVDALCITNVLAYNRGYNNRGTHTVAAPALVVWEGGNSGARPKSGRGSLNSGGAVAPWPSDRVAIAFIAEGIEVKKIHTNNRFIQGI